MADSPPKGKRPKPAPRQFVTVVSVGEIGNVEINGTVSASVETSLKLRLDVPGDAMIEEDRSLPCDSSTEDLDNQPSQIPDQVVVFRLPGERLGLGLKFDGGMTVSETVKKLFIQSVAPDSPAARATVPWGDLEVGDQILHIEGKPVSSMTRVECVSRLKEASVKLTIGVLKGNGVIPDTDEAAPPILGTKPAVSIVGGRVKRIPPPPIPPRTLARKSPARPPKEDLPPPPHGFDDSDEPENKVARFYQPSNYAEDYDGEMITYMSSSHRHVARMPPTPALYLDLLSEEEKISRARCESESDETNSSASTVIDRLSISSSRTVSRNSSFNVAAESAAKFDLARALSPFEYLEKEINTEKRQRSLSTPHLTYSGSFSSPTKKSVEIATDTDEIIVENINNKQSPKNKVKATMKSFSFSLKSRPFSWHNSKQEDKLSQIDTKISSQTKRCEKRKAPLPPPRSINSCLSSAINSNSDSFVIKEDRHDDLGDANEVENDDQDVFESEDPPSIIEITSPRNSHQIESETRNLKPTENRSDCVEQESINMTNLDETDACESYTTEEKSLPKFTGKPMDNEGSLVLKYPAYIETLEGNGEEPLDTETYETKKLFFIDHATNPSYGLPPLLKDLRSTPSVDSINDSENQDDYYEEIDSASESSKKNEITIPTQNENFPSNENLQDSELSPFSISSLSNTSLSSNDFEKIRTSETSKINTKNSGNFKVIFDSEVSVETNDEYDYVDLGDEEAKINEFESHKKFSQVSRDIRLREDLGELLKKDLELGNDAQVEIEEEEVVESYVECQTEEEILLVLRALHSDNSFSLEERSDDEDDERMRRSFLTKKDAGPSTLAGSEMSFVQSSPQEESTNFETVNSSKLKNKKVTDQPLANKGNIEQVSLKSVVNSHDNQECRNPSVPYIRKTGSSRSEELLLTNHDSLDASKLITDLDLEYSSQWENEEDLKSLSEVLHPSTGDSHHHSLRNYIKMVARGDPLSESESSEIMSPDDKLSDDDIPMRKKKSVQNDCELSGYDPSLTFATISSRTIDDMGVVIPVPQQIFSHSTKNKNGTFVHSRSNKMPLENVIEELEEPPSPPSTRSNWSQSEHSSEDYVGDEETSLDESISPAGEKDPKESTIEGSTNSTTLYEQRCSTNKIRQPQSSPPSYSRLPPDGHEFPANYTEGLQEKLSRLSQLSNQEISYEDSAASPSTLPKTPTRVSPTTEGRPSSRWRRQDEKSEKSVRDKIAMFSSEKAAAAAARNKKIHRSESVSSTSSEKVCMKRSLTEDDVRIQSNGHDIKMAIGSPDQNSKRMTKTSAFSSMINVHSSNSESKENVKPASSEADIRERDSPRISRIETQSKKKGTTPNDVKIPPGLNNRSQSLIDIGKTSRVKRHSVGSYDRQLAYKYGVEKPEERERRTSLTNMIEQRRKSISKLRGLVIPEARVGEGNDRLPIDLPKISSNTSLSFKTMSLPRDESRISRLYKADSVSSIDSCSSTTSRHSTTANKFPKHSPANNRKSSLGTTKNDSLPPLIYRVNRNQSPMSDFSGPTSTPRTISPQRSIDRATTPNSDASFEIESNKYTSERTYVKHPLTAKHSYESRLSKNDDSDNDSAVSSTQSSFSQNLSPRASPMPDQYDVDDHQSSTRRVHHSPQSSYDELDPKRVLKSGSIEAENRRNILNSAKCSSGRSSDEQSTPEIVRKYSKPNKGSSELREGSKKYNLTRKCSMESSTSGSSYDSRRNSRDTLTGHESKVAAEPIYLDQEGDVYKESQVKVAYLNEIVDDYEEINDPTKENVIVAEIPLVSKSNISKNKVTVSTHEDTKWNALEQKYSKRNDHESFENKMQKYISPLGLSAHDRNRSGVTTKQANFKAVADKWKQRTEEDPNPRQPNANRRDSLTRSEKGTSKKEDTTDSVTHHSRVVRSLDETSYSTPRFFEERPTSLNLIRSDMPDRKFSVPEYGSSPKRREKRDCSKEVSSRPTSLIEGNTPLDPMLPENQYLTPMSPSSTSTDSRDELLDSTELSRTGSKEILDAFSKPCLNNSSPKISDIMRAFERHDMHFRNHGGFHPRMSSLDSTGSDDGSQGAHYGSVSSLTSGTRDQYGSITSLSSSTSIISPQELQQLIEEANYSLEESGTPSHEILVVVLHREIVGHGSIGITLAGGADYETKEITVHKVIPGSLSDRDGRIQKGDRVLSINGKTLRGVSHREALNILKSPRPEVVLVLSRSRSVTPQESTMTASNGDVDGGFSHRPVFINHVPPPRPPKILESPMDSKSLVSDTPCVTVPRGPPLTITLVKDGAGLGFSLEGGKDSPLGDRPLTVKKVFSGGAADKGGILVVGDELLSVNSVDLTNMARIEAWNFLKKLPDGTVSLVIRKKLKEETASCPETT